MTKNVRTYIDCGYAELVETDCIGGTLKLKGGASCGQGGGETLILETLVFDEGQITCPTNGIHPKWNGMCHGLTLNAGRTVVVIREVSEAEQVDTEVMVSASVEKRQDIH